MYVCFSLKGSRRKDIKNKCTHHYRGYIFLAYFFNLFSSRGVDSEEKLWIAPGRPPCEVTPTR